MEQIRVFRDLLPLRVWEVLTNHLAFLGVVNHCLVVKKTNRVVLALFENMFTRGFYLTIENDTFSSP